MSDKDIEILALTKEQREALRGGAVRHRCGVEEEQKYRQWLAAQQQQSPYGMGQAAFGNPYGLFGTGLGLSSIYGAASVAQTAEVQHKINKELDRLKAKEELPTAMLAATFALARQPVMPPSLWSRIKAWLWGKKPAVMAQKKYTVRNRGDKGIGG